MSTRGPRAAIPLEFTQLQPHIRTIVDSINKLMRTEFGFEPSKPLLNLMRNYLNKSHLHFIFANQNYNRRLHFADIHDSDLPLVSLVMTLKLFFLFLKNKAKRYSDIDNVFKSDFHFLAAFTSASLLAYKLTYEELRPENGDIHDVLAVMHTNILGNMRAIIASETSEDEWWLENKSDSLRLLDLLADYSPFEDNQIHALDLIAENLAEPEQSDFVALAQKLTVLSNFNHFADDSDISDEDKFYADNFHDDNFSLDSCASVVEYRPEDYEAVSRSSSASSSDSYEGSASDLATRRFIFNLSKFEKDFLQTLDYRYTLEFSLCEAYQLLYHAKRFVVEPNTRLDSFIATLEDFGQFNARNERFALTRYEQYRKSSTQSMAVTPTTERNSKLRKFSY